jgi:hypothetical protein
VEIKFEVRKMGKKKPFQLIEVQNPEGKITPSEFVSVVDQIAEKMWSNLSIVFKLGDKLPDWAIGMLFLQLETVDRPWVGLCRDEPNHDVVVTNANFQNPKAGDIIPFAVLGL